MVKFNWKKNILVLAVVLGAATSCDNIEELNIDPNEPTTTDPSYLMTHAQFGLSTQFGDRAMNIEGPMLFVQHVGQNEYAEDSRFVLDGASWNTSWDYVFAGFNGADPQNRWGGLSELKKAKELVAETSFSDARKANMNAVLDIMIIWAFHNMTDMWGDMPYSQALDITIPTPAYDSQEAIYTSMISSLTTIAGSIDASQPGFASGDAVYGGDMAMWKKFANSLKLRIAMRMADVNSSAAQAAASSAISGGVFTSNAESAAFKYTSTATTANPLFIDITLDNRDDFSITTVLLDYLNQTNDPRLPIFVKPNGEGEYVGMPPGLSDNEAFSLQSKTSRPGDATRAADLPGCWLTYAEVEFFLAEANERWGIGGNAETHYKNAITASMNQWGITDQTAINNYINGVSYSSFGSWKEAIGTQKWVALYGQGGEAWAEWRRLDFPKLQVPAAAFIPMIPVRLHYPTNEFGTNEANVSAVGVDGMETKLWWDVN